MNRRAQISISDGSVVQTQTAGDAIVPPLLAPMPRSMDLLAGLFRLDRPIHMATVGCPPSLVESLEMLPRWPHRGSGESACFADSARVIFTLAPSKHFAPQSFFLKISPIHIEAFAGDEAGMFYAALTLRQLVRQYRLKGAIPALVIHDAPDFPVRGYLLDIRARMPTRDMLFRLVDQLAEFRINQLHLYAGSLFTNGNETCSKQNSLLPDITADDLEELNRYCRRHYIELVPHANSRDQDISADTFRRAQQHGRPLFTWVNASSRQPEWALDHPHNITILEDYFDGDRMAQTSARLAETGLPRYICPGTFTWNSIAGRWDKARANLLTAAEHGKRTGAAGYLITDWGENGHWQHSCFSLPPILFGASLAWGLASNRELNAAHVINTHIARLSNKDSLGEILLLLGNLYKVCTPVPVNGSTLFGILFHHDRSIRPPSVRLTGATHENLQCAKAQLAELDVPDISSPNPAVLTIVSEMDNARALLNHAACLGLARLDYHGTSPDELPEFLRAFARDELKMLLADFERIWLRNSCHNGLKKSMKPLYRLMNAYWPRKDRLPEPCLVQKEA
jgi:hypothetical protein